MPLVASVDYTAQRIFLGIDSVGIDVDVIVIYTEMRERRRLNLDNDRKFDPMIRSQGNEPAGPTNTPRRAVLESGVRIVPFDTSHQLRLRGPSLVSIAEGLAGRDLFDRLPLSVGVEVDIDYQPLQVEVIEKGTSGLTASEAADLQLTRQLHEADTFFDKDTGLLHFYQRGTTTDLIPPKQVAGEQVLNDVTIQQP